MEESDIIDRYLRSQMTPAERSDFEQRILSDDVTRRQVAVRRLIVTAIEESYCAHLKGKLREADASLRKRTINSFQYILGIAAALTAIGIVAAVYLTYSDKASPHDFDFFEAGFPNTMDDRDPSEKHLGEAMNYFKQKNYVAADSILTKFLAQHPANDTALYHAGVSRFRLNNSAGSLERLSRIAPESQFYFQAQHRRGLAFWLMGEEDQAIQCFQDLLSTHASEDLKLQASKALGALRE